MKLPRFASRPELLISVGIIAVLIVGILLFGQGPRGLGRDPFDEKQGSSHFTSPLGGKALYTLLDKFGIDTLRHTRKLELLDPDTTLLVLLAPGSPLTKEEAGWVRRWVARGGTLLWGPRQSGGSTNLLEAFGLRLEETEFVGPEGIPATLRPLDDRGRKDYAFSILGGFRLHRAEDSDADIQSLAEDSFGSVAVLVSHGSGRFIALAEPDLTANGGLSRGDHAEFAVHLAMLASKGGTVAFDEFHHGFQEGQTAMSILFDSPLAVAIPLALLAAFLGIFVSGRRLGPPIDLHLERRRRPAEFMDALANLCRRMKAGPQSMAMILSEFEISLRRRFGTTEPQAIEKRTGLAPGTLTGLMKRARRLSASPGAPEAALLACCRDLEKIRGTIFERPAP